MSKPTLFFVVGTRPEAIKMAPVVLEFQKFSDVCTPLLISTGQHREILHKSLGTFGLVADEDLAIMQHGQTLSQVTSRALEGIDGLIAKHFPAMVFGQGDTTTTMVAAMASFYRQIPYGHVEAGLRTDSVNNPFPEEYNRRVCGLTATHHYPPTDWSRDNLLKEGKDPSTVFVTGNTGIDAVLATAARGEQMWFPEWPGRVILLTTHRRENWGQPMKNIAEAALELVERFPDTLLVAAMHPNPTVRDVLVPILGNHERIRLIEPPEYLDFVKLMQRATIILSDSGGVQEEAPAFGIPVLVLRTTTERPEGVTAGTAKLVGTDREAIIDEGTKLLGDPEAFRAMANAVSPYGDGKASARIRYVALKHLGIDTPAETMWN
ncbi:non-hydrolyzing UDP-N-acetylglucosamine 2-epimerase [Fimbriimonas ginsengisoli]|uniref:UDP-N-acetylglucosamine 2-epimerase (non-hydrolyzing) n=1 Tax=Fimbriimonas ginsengisoli Gsoil 348 TaxID=661478 RepID=A0A068NS52_FIMGI|nr:UDP-N-acetylglucosamine 2-epimerase (non-hydrolyzing) [Fimbriimonas ginsengisoli]AIE86383.1 UDP-N-acetylglucosamine 2-epimerase [Fimbriimonas ginsengisoli Gsoil 348]